MVVDVSRRFVASSVTYQYAGRGQERGCFRHLTLLTKSNENMLCDALRAVHL